VWSRVSGEPLLETAIGLKRLRMFKEAETALLKAPANSPCYTDALYELLVVRLALQDYSNTILTGNELLQLGDPSRTTIFNTSLALAFAGRGGGGAPDAEPADRRGEHSASEAY